METSSGYCHPRFPGETGGCEGYDRDPKVGSLFPGESEQDFGYPVSSNGTKEMDVPNVDPEDED